MRIKATTLAEAGLTLAMAFAPYAKAQQTPFADWNQQRPGARHRISVADLPAPNPQEASTIRLDWSRARRIMASLEMLFYSPSGNFPSKYDGDAFAAEHGSWNRAKRAGYEVIRIPMHDGHAADGSYQDFLTGFVTKDGQVWGRPVGVAVGGDGALYVSDDGSRSVWRVVFTGK